MAFLDENGVAQFWAAVKDRLAGAFDSVEFDVAEQAANLMSGDSIATAFGKLAKNYSSILTSISDLNTNLTTQINTKLNKSDVLANYTTTATGKALDASLGPAIKASMDDLTQQTSRITSIIKVHQGRLVASGSKTINPGSYEELTSITIPGDDHRVWLVLGYTNSSYGGEGLYQATLSSTPADNTIMQYTRAQSSGGGGLMTWGVVNPMPNDIQVDRIISLNCYGYLSTAHTEAGRIYAFAIANTVYDGN